MLNKKTVEDLSFAGKRTFVRCDFNVPLDNDQNISDDTRIKASLPTIEHLKKQGAKIILASHLGRPKGEVKPEMSLKPVAQRLGELLSCPVHMAPDCIGEEVEAMINDLGEGEILLLENVRFHAGETKNKPEFAKALGQLAELFVNDAFGTAHREHASNVGITNHITDCVAGFLIDKEIEYFGNVIRDPKRPFIAVLGGAKISGKIPVIEHLMDKVDSFMIGGGMAFTFLKAKGYEVGKSLLEKDLVEKAESFMKTAEKKGKKILLPTDIKVADEFHNEANTKIVAASGIEPDWMGLDIGPETIDAWAEEISGARTIVLNGPMGAFEMSNFNEGTLKIAKAIANSGAVSIVGGGDTVATLDLAEVRDKISHVSTGGGASLDFLSGKTLPGIAALNDK